MLTDGTNRAAYFQACHQYGSIFLDPNTGLRLNGQVELDYLMGGELTALVRARPGTLTMVYDQSLQRGNEAAQMNAKLLWLADQNLFAFSYVSHASFLLATQEQEVAESARQQLLQTSRLPGTRFTTINGVAGDA